MKLPIVLCILIAYLGTAVTPGEMKNEGYAKFGGASKVHYGRFASGECFLTTSIEIAVYCRTKVFQRRSRTFESFYFLFYYI